MSHIYVVEIVPFAGNEMSRATHCTYISFFYNNLTAFRVVSNGSLSVVLCLEGQRFVTVV